MLYGVNVANIDRHYTRVSSYNTLETPGIRAIACFFSRLRPSESISPGGVDTCRVPDT